MAHIPDGFLSAPVLLGTAAASAGALGLAARRSRRRLGEHQAPLVGALTAFVLAAQMLNFPLGAGTSAHLLGGVLVGVAVGPWVGMLVLFSVVLVQALFLQDGGIAALGANTLNLAVLGVGVGWLIYRWLHALLGGRHRVAAAGASAFLTSALTGVAVAVQLTLSGTVPFVPALAAVGGGYVLVGVAEAALTAGILAAVLRSRPTLLEEAPAVTRAAWGWTAGLTLAALALTAGAVFSSARPDAFEAALHTLGVGAGGGEGADSVPVGARLGGAVGLAAAFATAWIVARLLARRPAA